MKIGIFLEGKNDSCFIIEYLKNICLDMRNDGFEIKILKNDDSIKKQTSNEEKLLYICPVGGKINERKVHVNKFETENKIDKKFFICDTDDDKKYKFEIIKTFSGCNENDIFLFPNNSEKGALEDLLIKIIPLNKKKYIKCFEEYKKCVEELKKESDFKEINLPNKKDYIHVYKLITGIHKKDEYNKEYWNFDHEDLNPLKNFLINKINHIKSKKIFLIPPKNKKCECGKNYICI